MVVGVRMVEGLSLEKISQRLIGLLHMPLDG
jgi:hypothetical protein